MVDSRQIRIDSYLPYEKGKVEKIHVRADGSKEKVESAVSITALQQSHLPERQKRQEPGTMENLSKKNVVDHLEIQLERKRKRIQKAETRNRRWLS